MTISQAHPNRRPYNWLIYDIGDEWLNRFTEHYKGNLYDLGCGEMPYKDWLLNYVDTYTGVDWGSSLHDLKADIVADLNQPLPIESEVADTLLSLSVMEHLREPQVFLKEAHRILKPDGSMIMQVPFMWWMHEEPHDFFRYTPYGLRFLLERAGFTEINVQPQAGFFTMITMKLNYFSRRFVCGPKIIRYPIFGVLSVIWFLSQKFAPLLDKLDRDWELEATGYFVIAKKK